MTLNQLAKAIDQQRRLLATEHRLLPNALLIDEEHFAEIESQSNGAPEICFAGFKAIGADINEPFKLIRLY